VVAHASSIRLGVALVEPNFADESIRVAELDRRIIARGKYDLDVVGRYARPNIFGLTVDTTPRNAVSFHGPCKNEAGDKATLNRDAELVERERRCLD
jgi:nitrilase